MGMLSVRLGADVITKVRRFARQDGVTVSQWIRKLVEQEMKRPERQSAVDVSLYPQSRTMTSGTPNVHLDRPPGSVTF